MLMSGLYFICLHIPNIVIIHLFVFVPQTYIARYHSKISFFLEQLIK